MLFPTLHKYYKQQLSQFWVVEEIDCSRDQMDYETCPEAIKSLVTKVLSFFAVADAIVMENISNFMEVVQAPEAKLYYAAQMCSEAVHQEMYELLILAIVKEKQEQETLLTNVPKYKSVQAKKAFAENWMNSKRKFCEKLVAFAFVEGLLFSASFASIYWLKEKNLFPGLTQSNELIARDENLHCEFACELHGLLDEQCSEVTIHKIVQDAVNCEHVFVEESINNLDGLDVKDMKTYVEFLADTLLVKLGVSKVYNTEIPYAMRSYITLLGVDNKSNFFEHQVTEYQVHVKETFNCDLETF